jgi:hypothetical protein
VEAVTRSLAESYGSFWDGVGEEDGSPFLPSGTQSVSNALRRAAETTPPMEKSVRNAMIRAESFAKAQNTKNLSNKSKERASVAGTIVKMLDRMDSSSNESLGAQMNLMIMKQLEEMNREMARRACEERRERAKEKKRRRKRREKKRAMQVAKRQVIQASLEELDDHGGNGPGFWSESSDSESSDSSNGSNSSNYGKGSWRNKKEGEKEDSVENNKEDGVENNNVGGDDNE